MNTHFVCLLHHLYWNYRFEFTDDTGLVQGIEIEGEDQEPDHEIEKTEKDREVVIEIVTAIVIEIEIVDQVVNDLKKIIIIRQKKLQLLSKRPLNNSIYIFNEDFKKDSSQFSCSMIINKNWLLLQIIKLSEVLYKTKTLKVIKKSNIDFYKICHRQKLILKIELWLLRNMKPLKNEGPKYLNLTKFHILSIEASMAKACENSNVVKYFGFLVLYFKRPHVSQKSST